MKLRLFQRGFTLIEVMIALAVVAIGLMAVLKAMNESIFSANLTRNKTLGLWMLENKVSEIRISPFVPMTGINQGQQLFFNQTWRWQTNTMTTANPKIFKIEVSVFSPDSKDKTEALLKQAIYMADLK